MPEFCGLPLKTPYRIYPIDLSGLLMVVVEACIEIPVIICGNAAGNGNGHSQYVDEDVEFTLHHTAEGDHQVIFDHTMRVIGSRYKTVICVSRLHYAKENAKQFFRLPVFQFGFD